jgi:hypothetical protein
MARGTDVDTNKQLTARVIKQLQTISMLLHWNLENDPRQRPVRPPFDAWSIDLVTDLPVSF